MKKYCLMLQLSLEYTFEDRHDGTKNPHGLLTLKCFL